MIECSNCVDLRVKYKISSPTELTKAIITSKENVINGKIKLFSDVGLDNWSIPFDELKAKGPWDDIIGYEFICEKCGTIFTLSCDTYHGNGSWGYKFKGK